MSRDSKSIVKDDKFTYQVDPSMGPIVAEFVLVGKLEIPILAYNTRMEK